MPRSVVFMTLLTICTAGCVPPNHALETALAPAPSIGNAIPCDTACPIQWQRAQIWISQHAVMKIQTATDVLLDTYNPAPYSTDYAVSIIKEPGGGKLYYITGKLGCGNIFGCHPKEQDVLDAMMYYIQTGNDLLVGHVDPGSGIR